MHKNPPRASGLDFSLRRQPLSYRHPRKTAVQPPPARPDPDLVELGDYLLSTRDFECCPTTRLIELQRHLSDYVQSCLANKQFVRANDVNELLVAIQQELDLQSRAVAEYQSQIRVTAICRRNTIVGRFGFLWEINVSHFFRS
jgi:hypothetical protein